MTAAHLSMASGTIAPVTEASPMFHKIFFTALGAALPLLMHVSQTCAAGFDCGVARTEIDHRICADPVLSKLDSAMKTAFDTIECETFGHDAETGKLVDPLGTDQLRWIQTVRNHCTDTACLIRAYRDRLTAMRRKWPYVFPVAETAAIAGVPAAQSWKTYTNVSYRYAICYPANLLKPGAEADNGDGLVFTGASGTSLRVCGTYNAAGDSLAALAGDVAEPPATITYRHLTGTSATVSGRKGVDIFNAEILLDQGARPGWCGDLSLPIPRSRPRPTIRLPSN